MKKVLLLSLPFGAMERPALGVSLLKACLVRQGIACDVRYFTLAFAEYIGADDYQWMSYALPYTAFAGDQAFTEALYGPRPAWDDDYREEILRKLWRLSDRDINRLSRVRSFVPHFLDHCMASVPWQDYAIVGFTSTFEQNIASLALARRIKTAYPEIVIVFGGANWEGEMGHELHRQFRFVDYVCSGESEASLPALVRHVFSGASEKGVLASIGSVVYRAPDGSSVLTPGTQPLDELDTLPYPDFSDYFRDVEHSTAATSVIPTLLFETSRGCWWGAKAHCTFCGLNGQTMAFRSKSARRALEELEYLVDRWRLERVEAVDNILDMKYFKDVLPALARSSGPVRLFYEVKANLSRAQVKLLRDAGVDRIQPGIESLSDHVLQLMRKGTTALRNIQLLKWAQEYGVIVEWNILYGFPGETADDYAGMLELLPAIRFLRPPCAIGPIRLDRFSPYHTSPDKFQMHNVRPMRVYQYLYPFDTDTLSRIAYYFDFDYAENANPAAYAADVIAYATSWQRDPQRGTLIAAAHTDGTLVLTDTRPERTIPEVRLSGLERAAYEYCDELHTVAAVTQYLRGRFPDRSFTDREVGTFLESLVANRLMATDGAHYLSLALGAAPLDDHRTPESVAPRVISLQLKGEEHHGAARRSDCVGAGRPSAGDAAALTRPGHQ